jgi:hypothetical protein
MSNQSRCCPRPRHPGTLKVWRGYEDDGEAVNEKTYACLKCSLQGCCQRFHGWQPMSKAHGYAGAIPRVFQNPRICSEGVSVEFFVEYASFLAKTVTLVIAILVVLASFAAHCAAKAGASPLVSCRSASSMISIKGCVSAWSRPCSTRISSRLCARARQSPRKARRSRRTKPDTKTTRVRAGFRRRHQGFGHRKPAP